MRVRLASTLVALAGLGVWPATAWGQADWPTYGGNAWNQWWSGLKQIDTRNVSRGLAFTGEGNGNFKAYESRTGKLLWQFNAGAGCNAAPMTFTHGGEQFIAVACGGNFQLSYPLGDAVMVFGFPKPWTP